MAESRRGLLLGAMSFVPVVFAASPALALIPDEEDEELIEKAKANRKERLAVERAREREFMEAEGLKDKKDDAAAARVQLAVYKLTKVGAQIDSGDLKGASATLFEKWVDAFEKSAGTFGSDDKVVAAITDLKVHTAKGDAKASKVSYVALVDAVTAYVSANGLSTKLKGL
ncbi:hypothetical protein FOA52_007504 [Chlamydomonas sp. UWO 241]|nr:hypothetical protein FOA52_007504 [Chlamydomonas sp. UWO 241]